MRKQEFLGRLRDGLSGLPQNDIEERLTFYSEMIDDQMEEGLSEEAAVLAAGSVETIVAQIVADIPFAAIAKERIQAKRRLTAWEIVLLVLGAPIWLSLGIAAAAVIFSLYVSLWSVIVSLWAVFGSLAACAVAGVLGCVMLAIGGNSTAGLAILAAGIVCVGLTIFMYYGCKAATTGTLLLTKKMAIGLKKCFIRKGESQ